MSLDVSAEYADARRQASRMGDAELAEALRDAAAGVGSYRFPYGKSALMYEAAYRLHIRAAEPADSENLDPADNENLDTARRLQRVVLHIGREALRIRKETGVPVGPRDIRVDSRDILDIINGREPEADARQRLESLSNDELSAEADTAVSKSYGGYDPKPAQEGDPVLPVTTHSPEVTRLDHSLNHKWWSPDPECHWCEKWLRLGDKHQVPAIEHKARKADHIVNHSWQNPSENCEWCDTEEIRQSLLNRLHSGLIQLLKRKDREETMKTLLGLLTDGSRLSISHPQQKPGIVYGPAWSDPVPVTSEATTGIIEQIGPVPVHGTRLNKDHTSIARHLREDHYSIDETWLATASDGAIHGKHDGIHSEIWAHTKDLPHPAAFEIHQLTHIGDTKGCGWCTAETLAFPDEKEDTDD